MAALNIGLDTISDFLKGIPELGVVNKLTPNSKITDEQCAVLQQRFQNDAAVKKRANEVFDEINKRKNKKVRQRRDALMPIKLDKESNFQYSPQELDNIGPNVDSLDSNPKPTAEQYTALTDKSQRGAMVDENAKSGLTNNPQKSKAVRESKKTRKLKKSKKLNKSKKLQLSVPFSDIKFSRYGHATVLYKGRKYSTIPSYNEKEFLLSQFGEKNVPIVIDSAKNTFKFVFSKLPKKKVQNIPNAQIPQKEQRITLEIENIEFLDNHYLIWIVREGKKDISIAPLKVADNNSHPCLKLIHKYFSERFPKNIDVIYNSERVIGLSQPYILSSYIKILNRNIDEHGEWWEEVQNARKNPLTVCRNIPAAQVYKDMSLRNSYIDYLAGMPNQKTVIKIYEVRQNQQEDVFIFTVSIGNGLYAVIYENVSFTATATWVFIVKEENYEECINRIFDYFTNYELHYKRQSLVKSLNPPQKFKAETYQKIMHDEPKGWIKRLNDILNREIPSNEIQFNQGLHIAAEANTRSVSSEMGKVQHLHNELMRKLYYQLCQKYGEENVGTENRIGTKKIDVVVKIDGGYNIYEIKTDAEPRGCVREAMGQILDYAFYECENVIYKMVIVGATPETKEVNTYLAKFREKNALEIYYMYV